MLFPPRALRFTFLAATLIATSCIAWESLYGDDCNGEWVESGAFCGGAGGAMVSAPFCGNGVVDPGEECDDANSDDTDRCISGCRLAFCGDGFLFSALEDCDDGNSRSGDGCNSRCRDESVCGDGEITGVEECDSGVAGGDAQCSETCRLKESPPLCGNGELNDGEICDDGNVDGDDSCSPGCTRSACGDGVQRVGVEDCEDGNVDNSDGCTRSCILCGQDGSFVRSNNHCYVFYEEEVLVKDAFATCATDGGYLWTGTSEAEVLQITRNVFFGAEVWVGLHRPSDDLAWITEEDLNFAPWAEGFPTNGPCVVQFSTPQSEVNFRNRLCSTRRPFVCEFEPAFIDPASHIAYRRFFETMSFADAEADCSERGGRLATPDGDDEASMLGERFRNEVWVSTGAEGICEVLRDGALDPEPCESRFAYVCEFL